MAAERRRGRPLTAPPPTRTESLSLAVGQAIRELRVGAEISQAELAHRSGVNSTYVGNLERGLNNASLRHVVAIAEALQMRPSELIAHAERYLVPRRSFPTMRHDR